jgi:hypothetical protein
MPNIRQIGLYHDPIFSRNLRTRFEALDSSFQCSPVD